MHISCTNSTFYHSFKGTENNSVFWSEDEGNDIGSIYDYDSEIDVSLEEPYEKLPKSQIHVYDHYGTNGKYGAVQTSRVLLQMEKWKEDDNDDNEDFKIKLCHLNCNNKFRGLSIYNPSSKHLGMSNCMKNQNEFKQLPTYWDTISNMTSIHKFPKDVVNDFLSLLRELLHLNEKKICLLSCVDKLNHRVRFEFYSHSTLLGDESNWMNQIKMPPLKLNDLLVSVNRDEFAEFQSKELCLVTQPIKLFLKACCEIEEFELKNFFFSMKPDQFSTLSFCVERSVEMMNLIGFSGRISSKMKKYLLEHPEADCIPWTNIPVIFFDAKTHHHESNFSLFVQR